MSLTPLPHQASNPSQPHALPSLLPWLYSHTPHATCVEGYNLTPSVVKNNEYKGVDAVRTHLHPTLLRLMQLRPHHSHPPLLHPLLQPLPLPLDSTPAQQQQLVWRTRKRYVSSVPRVLSGGTHRVRARAHTHTYPCLQSTS